MTSGFDVLVHEVMAAITTEPYDNSYSSPLKANFEVVVCLSAGML